MTVATTPLPVVAQPPDHPVTRKLRVEVLPYLESARLLNRQWFYILHQFFGYATDITLGLSGAGIGLPLLVSLVSTPKDGEPPVNVLAQLPTDPKWLYYTGMASIIVWFVTRVVFIREDGQKRAVLARSCRSTLRAVEGNLHVVLAKEDPMPELIKMVSEKILPTVDRAGQEEAWPWAGPAESVNPAVEKKLTALREKFERNWRPVDPSGLKEAVAA